MAAGPGFGRGGQEGSRGRGIPGGAGLPPRVLLWLQDVLPAFGLSRTGLCCWSSRWTLSGWSSCYRSHRLRLPFLGSCCICGRCWARSCTHSRSGSSSRRRHHGRLRDVSREYYIRLARAADSLCSLQAVKAQGGPTACLSNAHSRPTLRSRGPAEVGGASRLDQPLAKQGEGEGSSNRSGISSSPASVAGRVPRIFVARTGNHRANEAL